MSHIKAIRDRLKLTQTALASAIGCTQSNVGHYENKGQTMPPETAKRLIEFADSLGQVVTFEEIYGSPKVTHCRAGGVQGDNTSAVHAA